MDEERRREILDRLARDYPGSASELCELRFDGAFQLLAATILSAQCTDERVNLVSKQLFLRYPTPIDLAMAELHDVEEIIRSAGFYHNKAKNLISMAQSVALMDSVVPREIDQLTKLAGVGRKTANVVLSVAFEMPGLPVDTHVGRLARRLGLTVSLDPVVVETDLMKWVPPTQSGAFSLRLILHGRRVCKARKPDCEHCILSDLCPSYNTF